MAILRKKSPAASTAGAVRNETRKHYFLPRYVLFSPQRQHTIAHARDPEPFPLKHAPLHKEPSLYELTDSSGRWQVKIIQNSHKAISTDNWRAYGHQEMVIESPHPRKQFPDLSIPQIQRVLQMYAERWQTLSQMEGISYVSIFKNHGQRAGASQLVSHTQIMALAIIPPGVKEEAEAVKRFQRKHGGDPLCNVIAWEQQKAKRVIFEDEHAIAIAPYASSSAFAAWVMPKRHMNNLGQLDAHESHSMAHFLKKLTRKLDKHDIHFNFVVQNSLDGYDQHLVIKLVPRAFLWAGFEIDTGIPINPVLPEFAARWYNE